MIKKYICVSLLVLSFFFLGIDKAEAVESCICHADDTNAIGVENFRIYIENNQLYSDLINKSNVKGFYKYIAHDSANDIKNYMQTNDSCIDVYLLPETKFGVFGDSKTGNYYISTSPTTLDSELHLHEGKFSCSEITSEESDYRTEKLYNELNTILSSTKKEYLSCLTSSCPNVSGLKSKFGNSVKNMRSYCNRLYGDRNMNEDIYPDLFLQCENFFDDYKSWVEEGIIDDYAEACNLISEDLEEKLIWFLDIIKYGGVVLAIGLGMLDFLKAVLSDEGDANKKAIQKFIKRLIAAAIIFLIPLIIQFLITVVNINGVDTSNPFCIELG